MADMLERSGHIFIKIRYIDEETGKQFASQFQTVEKAQRKLGFF